MMSRRTMCAGAGASLLALAPARGSARDPGLAEIIARHTAARGGARALDAAHYERAEMNITEKGSTIRGVYQCSTQPAFRIDVYVAGAHVFCEGLDAHGPWLWPSSAPAPRDAVPDARKTGLQGIEFNIFGLHRFAEHGHQVFLEGREVLDGVNHYVLRVVMKDSYETFLFIDPRSWMIVRRRDFRAFHPDVDTTKARIENRYADFRVVDGIRTAFASAQYDLASGARVQTTVLTAMEYRRDYDPAVFDRTAAASS